jgi:hypothetical protein
VLIRLDWPNTYITFRIFTTALADSKQKKINSVKKKVTDIENKNGLMDTKVSRRKAVGTGAVVGAAVAGLVIGGAGGYFAGNSGSGSTSTVTSTRTVGSGTGATSTVTNTVTNTVT